MAPGDFPATDVVRDAEAGSWIERARRVIPGGASTGSKRSDVLYGEGMAGPTHFTRASGCRLTTADGEELIDFTMALGSVALGYADPEVNDAVIEVVRAGNVAALSHTLEVAVAEQLCELVPFAEQVRFLKSGAEGMAAAIRIARTHTGRTRVLGCGYFGWLDWSSDAAGVPGGTREAFRRLAFGDVEAARHAVAAAGDDLAAIVVEPVIERAAPPEWLGALRALSGDVGAMLIVDEIKTGFRVHPGGAAFASGITPDLAVFGKALANGYPLAAVVGPASIMHAAERTWISSTLASEGAALAAASVVLARHAREDVCGALASTGIAMQERVTRALRASGTDGLSIDGIAPMWFLRDEDTRRESRVLAAVRGAGVLLKRGAYNFASLAHDADALDGLEWALTHALQQEATGA